MLDRLLHRESRETGHPPSRAWPRALLTVWVSVAALGSCGDDTASPGASPGTLEARLTSPNGPEGALLVEIDGALGSVSAEVGHLFHQRVEGRTMVVVVLEEAGEVRFRFDVPDVEAIPAYRIIEVSGPDDTLRGDLAGYTLQLLPS